MSNQHTSFSSAARAILSYFQQFDNRLYIGGYPADVWADKYGTPLYIYDSSVMIRKVGQFRQAFPKEVKLYYAVKANPNPALLRSILPLVDGFDVASAGEIDAVTKAGGKPVNLSFAGPGKQIYELERALELGVGILSIESETELDTLCELARHIGVRPKIAIRVNPDFDMHGSCMKMGGGPKQFGIDSERIPDILSRVRDLPIDLQGFHIYAGSQNLKAPVISEAIERSLSLFSHLAGDFAPFVHFLNLGGGFGIPYHDGDEELNIDFIGHCMQKLLRYYQPRFPNAAFIIELGRYLVGECGVYLTRVVCRKQSRGRTFLVTDGGMNHHLAASGNFGQVLRRNFPIVLPLNLESDHTEKVDIVGPLCTPLDLLASQIDIPPAKEGDLLAILASGAYGYTASPINFLSHRAPLESVV